MTRPGDRAARGVAALDCAGHPSSANGREPPHDMPVEAAVLAALLLSIDAARLVLAGPLRAEHFYNPAHRHIFTAVQDLVAAGSPVDVVVVESLLRDRGLLDLVGGPSYLDQLVQATPAAEHVEAHAKIVFDKWRIRRAIDTHLAIVAQGYGQVGDVNEYLDGAVRAVAEQREVPRIEGGLVLGVRPLDVDELFAPLPPVDFLSRDLQWCQGRPATIVGIGGCGKTLAIQSAALSLASGTRPIWEHFAIGRRARVLHLDHDNGTRATHRRYQRLALGMGLTADDLRGFLRFVPGPRIRATDPRARDAYRRAVEGWDICFLDSLKGFTTGIDENDARIRDCFDQILLPASEDTGCAFVVLHHAGKGGAQKPDHEAGRGSSAIFDGSGSQLRFTLGTIEVGRGVGESTCSKYSRAGTIEEGGMHAAGLCLACKGVRCGPTVDEEAGANGSSGREVRRVTMAKAASEAAGKDLAPFYLDFLDVPDSEAVDPKAGVRVVYRADDRDDPPGRRDEAFGKALRYVRERTAAGEPVRGTEELARAIRVHHRTASQAAAQLERERLIANEPEQVGRGAPKPRLWACSTPDFSRPGGSAANGKGPPRALPADEHRDA